MKLFIGLGNPGEKYRNTRHNVGFNILNVIVTKIVDKSLPFELQKKFESEVLVEGNFIFAKPQKFMNASGEATKKLMNFYKVEVPDLWVFHDDLDIKLGQYKIQKGVGPKLHNGVESIEKSLGKRDFWRVRVGVDNRSEEKRISGEDYVLQNFSDEEKISLSIVVEKISEELMKIFKFTRN